MRLSEPGQITSVPDLGASSVGTRALRGGVVQVALYSIVCRKKPDSYQNPRSFHKNQRSNDKLLKYIEKLVKLNLSNIMPLILIRPLEVRGCLAILMVAYPHDGLPAGIEGLGDR
ncbi:MAG TPA: hypothetical protein VM715_23430 [Candidatus Acidoferrum sp.]|nr:hypothetical protein [Candidatus Acidoferrum sp.]